MIQFGSSSQNPPLPPKINRSHTFKLKYQYLNYLCEVTLLHFQERVQYQKIKVIRRDRTIIRFSFKNIFPKDFSNSFYQMEYRLNLGYCINHYFRVQLFSRFWTRCGNSRVVNFAIFLMLSLLNRHELKWKFSRGSGSRNSRK